MKTTSYNDKITIHIPHYKWSENSLIPIDFEEFEDRLQARLKEVGAESFYIRPAVGYYQGRRFDEDLLTVFCEPAETEMIKQSILDTFVECDDFMCQESYGYELNGALYIVSI